MKKFKIDVVNCGQHYIHVYAPSNGRSIDLVQKDCDGKVESVQKIPTQSLTKLLKVLNHLSNNSRIIDDKTRNFEEYVHRFSGHECAPCDVSIDDELLHLHSKGLSIVDIAYKVIRSEKYTKYRLTALLSGKVNTGESWSKKDDSLLEKMWLSGKTVEELATIFLRSEGGIKSHLKRLGLLSKHIKRKPHIV